MANYIGPKYEKLPAVSLFHSTPRFGNTDNIESLLDEEVITEYVNGLLFVPLLLLFIFIIWIICLLVFKLLGFKRVGILSGSGLSKRNHRKQVQVRILFLLCFVLLDIFAALFIFEGIRNVENAVSTFQDSSKSLAHLADDALSLTQILDQVGKQAVITRNTVVNILNDDLCPGKQNLVDSIDLESLENDLNSLDQTTQDKLMEELNNLDNDSMKEIKEQLEGLGVDFKDNSTIKELINLSNKDPTDQINEQMSNIDNESLALIADHLDNLAMDKELNVTMQQFSNLTDADVEDNITVQLKDLDDDALAYIEDYLDNLGENLGSENLPDNIEYGDTDISNNKQQLITLSELENILFDNGSDNSIGIPNNISKEELGESFVGSHQNLVNSVGVYPPLGESLNFSRSNDCNGTDRRVLENYVTGEKQNKTYIEKNHKSSLLFKDMDFEPDPTSGLRRTYEDHGDRTKSMKRLDNGSKRENHNSRSNYSNNVRVQISYKQNGDKNLKYIGVVNRNEAISIESEPPIFKNRKISKSPLSTSKGHTAYTLYNGNPQKRMISKRYLQNDQFKEHMQFIDQFQQVATQAVENLNSLSNFLEPVVIQFEDSFSNFTTYRGRADRTLEVIVDNTFWLSYYICVVAIFAALLTLGTIIKLFGESNKYFQCLLSYLISPAFFIMICILIGAGIISFCFGIINSDICSGGDGEGSPEGTIFDLFRSNGINFNSMAINIIEHYIEGCRTFDPFGVLRKYQQDLSIAYDEVNLLVDTLENNLNLLQSLCKRDFSDVIKMLVTIGGILNNLLKASSMTLEMSSCERINKIYVLFVHEGTCTWAVFGEAWMFFSIMTVSVCGLIMITFRAAWREGKIDLEFHQNEDVGHDSNNENNKNDQDFASTKIDNVESQSEFEVSQDIMSDDSNSHYYTSYSQVSLGLQSDVTPRIHNLHKSQALVVNEDTQNDEVLAKSLVMNDFGVESDKALEKYFLLERNLKQNIIEREENFQDVKV
mmetsp:Transcript_962/g.1448  ORF Transcript_962/g.1448 Transcript_962/m.1448 type:complete len:998 (-) Transcript_962:195-3188(-)|eukprot:CAMPEP_0184868030 /NCGR_PEP_ID=MMETSP0580-20130426/28819_1 /TAXON_ID=1118495 /ORGANISM="Dactyliosolen fragilissimus" /LENGTH=997 /DNA_ID=CAMNT_0027368649 /DNA_START=168 /DNA_END=3161 /DNA_ORIENTATION=+